VPLNNHNIDRLASAWRDNAELWSEAVRSDSIESRRLVTNSAVLEAVRSVRGERVLDVGCGEGWLSRALAEMGRDVTGIDASERLIELASQQAGASFLTASYDDIISGVRNVGSGYDIMVCNYSLFTDSLKPLLRALRELGVAGAHLVVQTIHPMIEGGRYEEGWREERFESFTGSWSPMPWYFRTVGAWVHELRGGGWRIEEVREPVHPATGQPLSLILIAGA
jgi:2-polyprenyl-3-methyl-5-hydroxy-6-metoxy-1,4-benzoquinol methylase